MVKRKPKFDGRPRFMVHLGLLPPYSLNDVKNAYWTKARTAHPDAGGSAEEFVRLNEAYCQAKEYVRFVGDRRHWIGELTERFIRHTQCVEALKEQGAVVELHQEDWRFETMEDFAQLTEVLVGIRWSSTAAVGEFVEILRNHPGCFSSLRLLDLASSDLCDSDSIEIEKLTSLVRLDLRRTSISNRSFERLCQLPHIEDIHVKGCRVGWIHFLRMRWRHRNIVFHTNDHVTLTASPRTQFTDPLQWSLNR